MLFKVGNMKEKKKEELLDVQIGNVLLTKLKNIYRFSSPSLFFKIIHELVKWLLPSQQILFIENCQRPSGSELRIFWNWF